jgi:ATP-dependent DNA helicase DinG
LHPVEVEVDTEFALPAFSQDGWDVVAAVAYRPTGTVSVRAVPGAQLEDWLPDRQRCDLCAVRQRRRFAYLVLRDGRLLQACEPCLDTALGLSAREALFSPHGDAAPAPPFPVRPPDQAAHLAERIVDAVVAVKGGSRRDGQIDMARAVAHCLAAGHPLMVEGGTGVGKALDVATPIPTPRGLVPIGRLAAGDAVLDERGRPCRVVRAFAPLTGRPCFSVEFDDGVAIVADADHLWSTVARPADAAPPPRPWAGAAVRTTAELKAALEAGDGIVREIPLPDPPGRRAIVAIRPVATRPVRCIAVDSPSRLYLAGARRTPTHNSIAELAGAIASGRQVGVAPHTKAQQDQLIADLELFHAAFAASPELLGREFSHALLKGRSAYVCRNALAADPETQGELDLAAGPATSLGETARQLAEWAAQTETGDRSDVPFSVPGIVWSAFSVTAEQCLGRKCAYHDSCFATVARAQAESAQIIVMNQAYLAVTLDRPFLLPATVSGIVVDEAHEWASVVSKAYGAEISPGGLDYFWRASKAIQDHNPDAADLRADFHSACADLAKALAPGRPGGRWARTGRAAAESPDVRSALAWMAEKTAAIGRRAEGLPEADEKETAAKTLLVKMAENLLGDIGVIASGADDSQVVWADYGTAGAAPGGNGGEATLRAAQFDVSGTIASKLVEPYGAVVFTSATLAVAGRFDVPAARLGLDAVPHAERLVASPFDYARQGLVWLVAGMPAPDHADPEPYHDAAARALAPAVRALGGRTLVLTTSWRAVGLLADRLEELVGGDFPVLRQEPGQPAKLVQARFTEDPAAVLVATRSFWSGVSIEGDTCSLVALTALPFPPRYDPVVSARSEKAEREGRSGFAAVSLPDALTRVTQGAGRAIRTVADRGVIAVLDPRCHPGGPHAKGYAGDVLRSLPPMPVTSDWERVRQFCEAIAGGDGTPIGGEEEA